MNLPDKKKALLAADSNPLGIPAAIYRVDEIPILGSGKTDFNAAKAK